MQIILDIQTHNSIIQCKEDVQQNIDALNRQIDALAMRYGVNNRDVKLNLNTNSILQSI